MINWICGNMSRYMGVCAFWEFWFHDIRENNRMVTGQYCMDTNVYVLVTHSGTFADICLYMCVCILEILVL